MMDPAIKHGGSVLGVVVDGAVGPCAQCRLDEALGFAVGLRPVRSGEAVFEAESAAGVVEGLGAECRAVVGEHASDAYAQRAEVGHGVAQELYGTGLALIGVQVGEADARMVVDCHKQELPAGAVDRVAPIAGDSVARSFDAAELLGVDVNEIAGMFMLVAHDRFGGLEIPQPGQPCPGKHPAHGALGHPQARGNSRLNQAPAAQLDDRQRLGRSNRSGAALRARGTVGQPGLACGQVAATHLRTVGTLTLCAAAAAHNVKARCNTS